MHTFAAETEGTLDAMGDADMASLPALDSNTAYDVRMSGESIHILVVNTLFRRCCYAFPRMQITHHPQYRQGWQGIYVQYISDIYLIF